MSYALTVPLNKKVIEEVDGVFHVTMWRCDSVLGPAHCGSYRSIKKQV
jgi:hypothetical protein